MIATLVAMGGCASLGGNIRGDFACRAPDGLCAPSAAIDDRALAMISGDDAGAQTAQAQAKQPDSAASGLDRIGAPSSFRATERILRIVFPAWVDKEGRLHETSAVRAVVSSGSWQPLDPVIATSMTPADNLAEAVDRADSPASAGPDPAGAPDPAKVAAARARLDPVAAIKAEVDRRAGAAPTSDSGSRALTASVPADDGATTAAPPVPRAPAAVAPPRGTRFPVPDTDER